MDAPPSPANDPPGSATPASVRGPNWRYVRVVWGLWLVALAVICVRAGLFPHKQSVFSVDYWWAGKHWLQGKEIYSRSEHFLYSPLTAAAFVPFAVLPLKISGIVWRLVCAASLGGIAAAWLRSGLSGLGETPPSEPGSKSFLTAFLLLLPLAIGNLNLGQINPLVLVLSAGGVLAVHGRRWNLAAVLLAAAGYMKIYPLAIGLLLALLYPRQLVRRLALAVLGLFIVSLILQKPSYAWTEYHSWFVVLGADNRLDIDLYASWRDFGFLLRACGIPLSDRGYRVMEVVSGAGLGLFLLLGQRYRTWKEARLLGGVFSLGCAWMVLFGPATEAATYVLLSLPVCAALVAAWKLPDARAQRMIFALSYALLLLSDVTNAWVHAYTHHLYMRALQPVATLLFIAGIVLWLVRPPVIRA